MARDRLGFASFVVLALVGDSGAGVHDIARGIRQGSQIYGGIAPSLVYAEAKRLCALGLLSLQVQPGRTTARSVYALTAAGRAALVDWLAAPSPFPTLRQEVTLRLLAGDLIGEAAVVASVTAMRGEIGRIEGLVAEMEAGAARLPHRRRYLMLQHRLARRLLAAYRAWVDEVEAELGSGSGSGSGGSSGGGGAAAAGD